jgi:2-succinyl-5-enolpyruvyl-6-hydroxy-3-cyclohexene-1-carboxylate synthase
VIVFGHPTLSREIPVLIARVSAESIVVASPGADWFNPGHAVTQFTRSIRVENPTETVPPSVVNREWLKTWVTAGRFALDARSEGGVDAVDAAPHDDDPTLGFNPVETTPRSIAREELAVVRAPVTRRVLADAVWRNTWPHDRLVFGASRLIRVADETVVGKKIRVHSNRGLSGIDGTVSTGVGVALASQRDGIAGVTRVLLGDLAMLHDVGGMLVSVGETRPRIQVVVGNDGAGTIFAGLEVAATADPAAMARVLLTPQRVDLASLARAYGWEYRTAANRNELERALTESTIGPTVIDVRLEDN